MDEQLLATMSKEQLVAFSMLQASNKNSAARKPAAKRQKVAPQPADVLAEPISDHYRYFFDLPRKMIIAILQNSNSCEGLNAINIQEITMEQALWILWHAYGVYSHTKIPKNLAPTLRYVVAEMTKCYKHRGKSHSVCGRGC